MALRAVEMRLRHVEITLALSTRQQVQRTSKFNASAVSTRKPFTSNCKYYLLLRIISQP